MSYQIRRTTQFKKDCKRMKKRGANLSILEAILEKLQSGEGLPEKNCDHALVGNYAGFRECHISSDWLLIYYVENDFLILTCTRTGSHSDLF